MRSYLDANLIVYSILKARAGYARLADVPWNASLTAGYEQLGRIAIERPGEPADVVD